VVLAAAGGEEDASELVGYLASLAPLDNPVQAGPYRVEEYPSVNPVLAGRCIVEGQARVSDEVLEQVVKSLVATMHNPEVALRSRIAAGRVAGELGAWLATLDGNDLHRKLKDQIPGMTDVPEMVEIPAGEFWMGTSEEEAGICRRETGAEPCDDEYLQGADGSLVRQKHRVQLGAYAIGRYPVTNYQFGRFVADGGYDNEDWWGPHWKIRQEKGWEQPGLWNDPRHRRPNEPVEVISWCEARAYARWLAAETEEPYRLPTEGEWERAARGPSTGSGGQRVWPWGNEWDSARCNIWAGEYVVDLTPVGIYPAGASPDGCEEMIGGMWEWCASEYQGYPFNVNNNHELMVNDPLLRGASRYGAPRDARAAYRNHGHALCGLRGSDGARLARGL
jgi:formylglycine-generating enzyme required for sulfatase activity